MDDYDDSEEDSEDECPECFEEIGDFGISQEYGRKKSKHFNRRDSDYFEGLDENMHHHRKDGVGETIMSDDPIRSEYGQGGRSSFGGDQRGFSFDFKDFRRSPTSRHYETKGHSFKYGYEEDED